MKSNTKYLLWALVPLFFLHSCEKDEVKTILKPGGNMQLNVSVTTLVLAQANAANQATVFNWNKADFGYSAAINYTIQMCRGGTNFSPSATTEVNVSGALSKAFTVGEFNSKMLEIISDGVPSPVQVRVKATVSNNVDPIFSNVVNMTVTAYADLITYTWPEALNIAGNYQGWNPATAPQIVRQRNGNYNGYEGYIVFNHPTPEFKMVKGDNWGAGDFGSAGGDNLGNAGPNLTLPSGGAGIAGLYRIRADLVNMKWRHDKINTWGIIGTATSGGWSSSTPMTFNPSNGSWSITTNLNAGEMKFRANDSWAINFGDNAPADGKPEYDGANISIPQAGNYTITLSIGVGGNYSYKIRRN